MRRPILDRAEFVEFHQLQEEVLFLDMTRPRGVRRYGEQTVVELLERSASVLFAVNGRARLAFADRVHELFRTLVSETEGDTFFFVTFAPQASAVPLSAAPHFDVEPLRRWSESVLHDFHGIGIVEAAYYHDWMSPSGEREPTVSFHVHAIVWGCEASDIKERRNTVNRSVVSLIPGINPAHVRLLRAGKVGAQTWYMLKAPWLRYSVYPRKRKTFDPASGTCQPVSTGRFRQCKAPLTDRPGEAAKIAAVMTGRTLPDLLIATGDGVALLERARANAVLRIRNQDAWRRKRRQPLAALG